MCVSVCLLLSLAVQAVPTFSIGLASPDDNAFQLVRSSCGQNDVGSRSSEKHSLRLRDVLFEMSTVLVRKLLLFSPSLRRYRSTLR